MLPAILALCMLTSEQQQQQPCPENARLVDGNCLCSFGFAPSADGASCVLACPPRAALVDGRCRCEAGFVLSADQKRCVLSCPENAHSVDDGTGNSTCRCNSGHVPSDDGTACNPVQCPVNSEFDRATATCKCTTGFEPDAAGKACVRQAQASLPPLSFNSIQDNSTQPLDDPTGRISIEGQPKWPEKPCEGLNCVSTGEKEDDPLGYLLRLGIILGFLAASGVAVAKYAEHYNKEHPMQPRRRRDRPGGWRLIGEITAAVAGGRPPRRRNRNMGTPARKGGRTEGQTISSRSGKPAFRKNMHGKRRYKTA